MTQLDALPYRIYLLAYDTGRARLFDRTRTAFLARAAVLTELALRGKLTAANHPEVTGPDLTGDPVLDGMLAEISQHDLSWRSLIRRHYRLTLAAVEQQLQAAGVIAIRRHRTLGLLPRRAIDLRDPAAAARVRDEFTSVLDGTVPAADVNAADAALVALAASGRVRTVLSRPQARRHADRISALTSRLSALSPGLEGAVRRIEMMVVSAQGGG